MELNQNGLLLIGFGIAIGIAIETASRAHCFIPNIDAALAFDF